jgi:hexokinase
LFELSACVIQFAALTCDFSENINNQTPLLSDVSSTAFPSNVLFLLYIAALVNDTVGTLLAHSYKHPNTFIGAIFGTGTNGAYVEDTRNIKAMTNPTSDEMIINIEWGNFDKNKTVLPVTIFDNKLDRESIVS